MLTLYKSVAPTAKPNADISITQSRNNNLSYNFYTNGGSVYYSLDNDEESIKQFTPIQSNAYISALSVSKVPNSSRELMFIGDSSGKLTIIELLLETPDLFKVVKEIQIFNAIITEIVADNTASKLFIAGCINMSSNSSGNSANSDILLRFINWELGNSIGDPMGAKGSTCAISFASGSKNIVEPRVVSADNQGTVVLFKGSENGTGFKFVKTYRDSNSEFRGVVKDIKFSPSSSEQVDEMLASVGAYQRSKQGIPIRGQHIVSVYSDKRIKLFNGDDLSLTQEVISSDEIKEMGSFSGGWSLVEWINHDTFLVSGKCGTRIYKISNNEASLVTSNDLKLYGVKFENGSVRAINEFGFVTLLQLADDLSNISVVKQFKGIHKGIHQYTEGLVSTQDGQIFNYEKKILYENDDNVELSLLEKLSENKFISLNKAGDLTLFTIENGIKDNIDRRKLNINVNVSHIEKESSSIVFSDFNSKIYKYYYETHQYEEVSTKVSEEITGLATLENELYVSVFDQTTQSSKIVTKDKTILTHKARITKFIVTKNHITFSDVSGKTQVQCLVDKYEVGTKQFSKDEIIVSVNKWSHHTGKITDMVWKPQFIDELSLDDTEPLLATVGLDNMIVVYSLLKTIRPKYKLENCHRMGIVGVQFVSSDELVTFGVDGCINYWKL
ncbi:hypothetical protein ACO0OE_001524 [Hanseniaspora uvarum]